MTVNEEQPDRSPAWVTAGAVAVPLLVLFVRVARSSWLPTSWGSAHTISEASARSLVVVAVDDAIDEYRNNPTYRGIARYDPLSYEQRADRDAIDAEFRRAGSGGIANLNKWVTTHPREQSRLQQLDARGMRIELFLHAP